MDFIQRYWTITRLLSSGGGGYQLWPSPLAQQYFEDIFSDATEESSHIAAEPKTLNWRRFSDLERQTLLIQKFRKSSTAAIFPRKGSAIAPDSVESAYAGLCLRCFVSDAIRQTCWQQARQFGRSNKQAVFQELISELLDDDGKTLVLLDGEDDKIHYKVELETSLQQMQYRLFTLEILRKWQPGETKRQSLDNWARYVTKYHNRLTNILVKSGYQRLSDWAQLNRARAIQTKALAERDRQLIAVFHQVYRQDWLWSKQNNPDHPKKCPEPSASQLAKMLERLAIAGIAIASNAALLKELRQVAGRIREDELARRGGTLSTEPLERIDPETGEQYVRTDLPNEQDNDLEKIESREILTFLQTQLFSALEQGVALGVTDRLTELQNRRRRVHAAKFIPGLRKIYFEGASQRDLQAQLGFSNGAQVARVLAPKKLITQVRLRTLDRLLEMILAQAHEMGLTEMPPQPHYLSHLVEQLENFVDSEIFTAASSELIGRDRNLNSSYAEALRRYLNTQP